MTPMPPHLWIFRARAINVVDADTIDVVLDTAFRATREERLRLLQIDAPEVRGPTRAAGIAATEYVRAWLSAADVGDWPLRVETHKSDSFGRFLAMVWRVDDQRSLNDDLLSAGHAVPYDDR